VTSTIENAESSELLIDIAGLFLKMGNFMFQNKITTNEDVSKNLKLNISSWNFRFKYLMI
jgi:hypothetical protein